MARVLTSLAWLSLLGMVQMSVNAQSEAGFEDPSATDAPGRAEQRFSLWIGHSESSNATRSTTATRGSYDSFGATADLRRHGNRVRGGLVGDIEFRSYAEQLSEEETVGYLTAFADTYIVPDIFAWSFDASYSEGRSDPFGPDTPANRENVAILSHGPELALPMGDRTSLTVASTDSKRHYAERSDLDSDSLTNRVGVSRRVREITSVGLFAEATEIEYDTTALVYDIDSLKLSYEHTLAHGLTSAVVGRNRIDLGGEESTGPLIELLWRRSLTSRSSLTLSADHGFTDAGQLYELGPGAINAADVLLVADITEQSRLVAAYSFDLPRTQFLFQAEAVRDEFQRDTDFNSDSIELTLEIKRELTTALSIGVDIFELRRDFVNVEGENVDHSARVWLNRRFSRRLGLVIDVRRDIREGTDAYEENSYQVGLVFTPSQRRVVRPDSE